MTDAGGERPKDDLVERLLDHERSELAICMEAAAEIERLRAENAGLKERARVEAQQASVAEARIDEQEAEIARLREVEREAEASKTDPISWCNLKKRSGEMREEVKEAAARIREQEAEIARLNRAAELYTEAASATTLQWERRAERAEAERDALRNWIDNNMTHYNTAEAGARPILAEFGKRVWYHVTDDCDSFPFSAAIDAAMKEKP